MRITLTIDGATEAEMRALVVAHTRVVEYNAVDSQPTHLGGKHRGGPFVGVEGPEHYGIETYALTPAGAEYMLAAILATTDV